MNPIKNLLSFKTTYEGNKTYLVFSIEKKEEINYSEVQMLEKDAYRSYFLPFQCTKTSRSNKISFDVSGLTALSEYLKTEMKQDQYFELISDIQKIISACQKAYLSYDNLVCDPKYMYYHNTLKKVLMIYIPVKNQHYICDSIPKCLINIHKSARRVIITDGNYMNNYENFLSLYASSNKKKGNSFSPDSLLHFFNENIRVPRADDAYAVPEQVQRIPSSESKYSINSQIAGDTSEVSDVPRRPVLSGGTKGAAIQDLPSSATSSPSFSATVVRARREEVFMTDAFGKRYDIKRFPFTVGRSQNKDLVVDQPTVSGEHAIITEENGRYFIKDVSTNGTYVNDEDNKITYTEIVNGDQLYFDRYCFVFSVTGGASVSEDVTSRTVMVSRRKHSDRSENIPEPAVSENTSKAAAYLEKMSDGSVIRIMDFPFSSPEAEGAVIFLHNTGEMPDIFIKNVSCGSLAFEGNPIGQGETAEIFSCCTLEINGEKYMFKVEN